MKEEVVQRLLKSAQLRASLKDYRLDSGSSRELENLIRTGVNRLSGTQVKSEVIIQGANKNINELVDLMIKNSGSIRITKSLNVSVLNASLKGFCPRHPFC